MAGRWYRNAAIYSLDVGLFQDSNADGIGDLPGLTSRLDYLSRLGVTTLWLNPIHPSPRRDGGYDITDHYGVHPASGAWVTSRRCSTRLTNGACGSCSIWW